jgi:hypothetical protein
MALVVAFHGVTLDGGAGVPEGVGDAVTRLPRLSLSLLGAAFGFQIGVVRRISGASLRLAGEFFCLLRDLVSQTHDVPFGSGGAAFARSPITVTPPR